MPQKLLYLVSEDWSFLLHRLPMARAARDAGYEVHVATHVVDHAQQIEDEGFTLHPIAWQRGSTNPLRTVGTVMAVRALYRLHKPDIVHHVAFVSIIIGSLAALGLPMAKLNALTGLGFVFTSETAKALMLRPFANRLLGFLLRRPNTMTLVQNPDDRVMVEQLGVDANHIALIPGSGVDVDVLKPMAEPLGPFTVGFVGRLLQDKGVETLVRAQKLLSERGLQIRVLLAGMPDPSNPASIPEETLAHWRRREHLLLLGHVDDISIVWAQAHVAALPSRREGLPKSLLEAAACGRPMIATDVPGCREIVRAGINGFLVPTDDEMALADAIERLHNDRDLRCRFGNAARQIAVDEFSSSRVGHDIVTLYARLLATIPLSRQMTSTGEA